ncbi:hypothetical protein WNX12_09745, partial [Limosilactobacillus fermentum]|uniref:hypothetical protein n=1 Tax=Limosilactobacillus fermentum TaxID=1613 RepID=UPI0030E8F445
PGPDCIKWHREQKKGGARCTHRPPPKMTHQQDLTKSQNKGLGENCVFSQPLVVFPNVRHKTW